MQKMEQQNMEADKITALQCRLKKTEEERQQAAEYGMQLLESQSELQNQLEKCRVEMMTVTENYEQEKYTLQREVELKNRMLESLTSEYEAVKQQHKVHLENLQDKLGRSHEQEVKELKSKLEKLKAELDEARLSESQLKHKIDHQKELLSSKSEEIQKLSERAHESMSSEVLTLQVELTEAENQKLLLKEELNELQYRQEQLELLSQNLVRQVERLKEEKEEREKEAASYCNAFEKAREANQDLQVQLDQALQQASDPSSKGNSLFAEVEDRRAAMERQLISMKVKYQSLKKQNAFNREQMQRMKLQIAALLQMKGSQAECDQQERLFAMVEQKNGEIKHLLREVESLQKFKTLYENMEAKPSSSSLMEDNTYYTDLLQMKLDNVIKEYENCKGEFSVQRMKALFESQRALDLERKLFANERSLQVSQSENIQLRARLDELKLKYEPEEKIEAPVVKKRREVLPLDTAPPEQGIATSAAGQEGHKGPAQREEAQPCPQSPDKKSLQSEAPVPLHLPEGSLLPPRSAALDTQPRKEKKCVRLVDVPAEAEGLAERNGNTPDFPRLTAESKLQKDGKEGDAPASRVKGARKSSHPIMYVSSKSTPETQCPQQ